MARNKVLKRDIADRSQAGLYTTLGLGVPKCRWSGMHDGEDEVGARLGRHRSLAVSKLTLVARMSSKVL